MVKTLVALAMATFMIGATRSAFAQTVMHDHSFEYANSSGSFKEEWHAVGGITKGGTVLDTARSDGSPGLFYLTKKLGDISHQEVEITGVGIIQRAGAGGGTDVSKNIGIFYVIGTVQKAPKSSLTIQWKAGATAIKTLVVSIT